MFRPSLPKLQPHHNSHCQQIKNIFEDLFYYTKVRDQFRNNQLSITSPAEVLDWFDDHPNPYYGALGGGTSSGAQISDLTEVQTKALKEASVKGLARTARAAKKGMQTVCRSVYEDAQSKGEIIVVEFDSMANAEWAVKTLDGLNIGVGWDANDKFGMVGVTLDGGGLGCERQVWHDRGSFGWDSGKFGRVGRMRTASLGC